MLFEILLDFPMNQTLKLTQLLFLMNFNTKYITKFFKDFINYSNLKIQILVNLIF